MCPAIARCAFCCFLLKFVGTDKRKKYIFWFFIVTQLLVNSAVMLQVLVSCHPFAKLWDPRINGWCMSPQIQVAVGFFQGGECAQMQ